MTRPRPCVGHRGTCLARALTTHNTGRCQDCRRKQEQARGSREQRGYDHRHRQLRDLYKPIVQAGRATCWRCGQPITAGSAWDLGHQPDRSLPAKPEHQRCNRATNTGGRSTIATTGLTIHPQPGLRAPSQLEPKSHQGGRRDATSETC